MKKNNKTPKKNSTFIKKYYKSSTIPRLEDLGYKSIKVINECPVITEWLEICYNSNLEHGFAQDHLFHWIGLHQDIDKIRNIFNTEQGKKDLEKLFSYYQ
jgi:hypothetical protein